jgi:hypothetical protein
VLLCFSMHEMGESQAWKMGESEREETSAGEMREGGKVDPC